MKLICVMDEWELKVDEICYSIWCNIFFNNKEDFLFSFIERMSLRFIGSRLEHVSLVHV